MKKRNMFICLIIILLFSPIFYLLGFFPIAVDTINEKDQKNKNKIGDSIKPLKGIDFSNGDCEMYISYSFDDNFSEDKLLKGKVFRCDDKTVLINFQKDFEFKYTGSDISTANSKFYIYRNDELVFTSSIVVDKNSIGFQSPSYGWISNNNLKKYFKYFNKVFSPIIFFK